ncbi:MAG: phage holin family protein [Dehalococcoidia bacterium]
MPEVGRETGREGARADGLAEDWRRTQAEMRGLGSSIGRISDELRVLMQRERELAGAEVADSADAARRAGMWGSVAAVMGLMALVFLGLTMMFALSIVWELWLAALATMAVFAVIGAIAAWLARRQFKEFSLVPTRTLQSIQEDMKWARGQIRRNGA